MFPTLTREQVSRIAAHGRRRATARGDVLVDLGDKTVPIFVVALARPAFLLETSRPRIFAVGDVRGGNVKRVASAVGEGSIAVAFVHQVLRQSTDVMPDQRCDQMQLSDVTSSHLVSDCPGERQNRWTGLERRKGMP